MICEQTDTEPDPNKFPSVEDFPEDVQKGIITYNKLGDKVQAEIGYLGKDFINLDLHMRILDVQCEDLFLETLLKLDSKQIEKSMQDMERARNKAKQKT